MAKKASKPGLVAFPVTIQVEPWMVEERIAAAVQQQVEAAVEAHVGEAVREAVTALVDDISRKRVSDEIDKVLAEGWPITNSYGERSGCGSKSLKDRVGEILNARDQYSSNGRFIDKKVTDAVDQAIRKDFAADIKAARESFKTQVDGVLAAVVKKAVGDRLGIKA